MQGVVGPYGEAYLMDNQPALARWHLLELERLCGGRACEEYVDLARALSEFERKRLPALPVPVKP